MEVDNAGSGASEGGIAPGCSVPLPVARRSGTPCRLTAEVTRCSAVLTKRTKIVLHNAPVRFNQDDEHVV